ncbi:MAG: carboxypeptidase-like regulatory domain-containing protein [Acidobacteriota bacterium]|nr:carboxypeptidase-like regulatory domain-containing protein [Acidobacteriota bacterium]
MKNNAFFGLTVAGLLAFKILGQTPQQDFPGVVTGRVVNQEGRPVVKAEVCASPTMVAWMGELPCGRSDSSGKFSIHIWRPAEYAITAVKEKEGYPNTHNTFYGSAAVVLPIVTMIEGKTHQEVTVRLGPPFGRLTGKIVDAETGKPIEGVRIELHHANIPANFMSLGTGYSKGRLRLLVSPVPIIFKISAPGYQGWWYGADGSEKGAEALQVGLGSTRELTIPLQPISKSK